MARARKITPPPAFDPTLDDPITSFKGSYEKLVADSRGRWHLTVVVERDDFDNIHPLVGTAALEVQFAVYRYPMLDENWTWEDEDDPAAAATADAPA
jgi:hypothetical protein